MDFCLLYSKNAVSLILHLFDVISKIATINCFIEFIAVVNYVKTISSDKM